MSAIQHPTDKDIATAKATAAERFGSDALELMEFDEPINAALLVSPFGRESWATFVDAVRRDGVTAHGQVFAERVLYPALEQTQELRSSWPALPSRVALKLKEVAGEGTQDAAVRKLSLKALPAQLTTKVAEGLIADAKGRALWSVELPESELSCVLLAPLPDVYLAAVTVHKEAVSKNERVAEAMSQYVLEAVVWSARPILDVVNRRPAVMSDLRVAYAKMGGEGAALRSKRI